MLTKLIGDTVQSFVTKFKVKEALIATTEGIPVYYYKDGRKVSDPYVLSAKVSSVLEMAKSMSKGLRHVILNDRYGKSLLIANGEYVLHIYISNRVALDINTAILPAKRLLANIKKLAE